MKCGLSSEQNATLRRLIFFVLASCGFASSTSAQNLDSLRRAGLNGDSDALFELTTFFISGRGPVEESLDSTFHYLEIAAEQGNQHALYLVGVSHLSGIYMPLDHEKGLRKLDSAAMQDNRWAMFELARYYSGQDYREEDFEPSDSSLKTAFGYARRAARQGSPRAALYLGEAYLRAEGVERNDTLARVWMETAADYYRLPLAQILIGYWHLEGKTSFGYDLERAARYFQAVRENGRSTIEERTEGVVGLHIIRQHKREAMNIQFSTPYPAPQLAPQLFIRP